MPNYEVIVKKIEIYRLIISSSDVAAAAYKACDTLDSAENKDMYHDDSDTEVVVFDEE